MEQFKMLVTDRDLSVIKEIAAAKELSKSIQFTILSETHIEKEFWEIEVLTEELFAVYHIGRLAGYREGKKFMEDIVTEYDKISESLIKAGKQLLTANQFYQQTLKDKKNGN